MAFNTMCLPKLSASKLKLTNLKMPCDSLQQVLPGSLGSVEGFLTVWHLNLRKSILKK